MQITQTRFPTFTVTLPSRTLSIDFPGKTTWTHFEGDDEFCWLFALTSSIHRTLLIKSGTGVKFSSYNLCDSNLRICILLNQSNPQKNPFLTGVRLKKKQ